MQSFYAVSGVYGGGRLKKRSCQTGMFESKPDDKSQALHLGKIQGLQERQHHRKHSSSKKHFDNRNAALFFRRPFGSVSDIDSYFVFIFARGVVSVWTSAEMVCVLLPSPVNSCALPGADGLLPQKGAVA